MKKIELRPKIDDSFKVYSLSSFYFEIYKKIYDKQQLNENNIRYISDCYKFKNRTNVWMFDCEYNLNIFEIKTLIINGYLHA